MLVGSVVLADGVEVLRPRPAPPLPAATLRLDCQDVCLRCVISSRNHESRVLIDGIKSVKTRFFFNVNFLAPEDDVELETVARGEIWAPGNLEISPQ